MSTEVTVGKELTDQMRATATFLDKLNDLYENSTYQWSPHTLRYEADYLDRSIPGAP